MEWCVSEPWASKRKAQTAGLVLVEYLSNGFSITVTPLGRILGDHDAL